MLRKDIFFEKEEEDAEWLKRIDLLSEVKKAIVVPNSGYQYKYNGKEFQDELGLDMYAMDMRMYDPAIARWVVQDPVTHHNMSPYNAFDNNPVFWADPAGASTIRPDVSAQVSRGGLSWGTERADSFNQNVIDSNRPQAERMEEEARAKENEEKEEKEKGEKENEEHFKTSNLKLEDFNNISLNNNVNADDKEKPRVSSFNFKTKKNWQTAAVRGIYFEIVLIHINSKGVRYTDKHTIRISGVTEFGMYSTDRYDNKVDNILAAEVTAFALDRVMSEISN